MEVMGPLGKLAMLGSVVGLLLVIVLYHVWMARRERRARRRTADAAKRAGDE